MDKERKQSPEEEKLNKQTAEEEKKQRSSAFNETEPMDHKSTINIEEANLEQERKEAMRERD